MKTSMIALKGMLPHPEAFYQEAKTYNDRYDLSYEYEFTESEKPDGFATLLISNGGGDEAAVFFYKEHGEVVATLITVYYNEGTSNLTPNIAVTDGSEENQPAFVNLPFVFNPVVGAESPALWNWEEYPATCKHLFASGSIWNTGGAWETPPYGTLTGLEGLPIDPDAIASDILGMLKEFSFAA